MLKNANTEKLNIIVFYVVEKEFVLMVKERVAVYCVVVLEYVNIIYEKLFVKHALELQFVYMVVLIHFAYNVKEL